VQNLLRSYKASLFQALSHPTRVAIVEALRAGELSAGAIQDQLGVEQANRKDGNQVFYSLRSPVLSQVLDIMRGYFQANLTEAAQMLSEIEAEPTQRGARIDLPAAEEAASQRATEGD
jgi:DNA-binding transcriptional ArsR family regulator